MLNHLFLFVAYFTHSKRMFELLRGVERIGSVKLRQPLTVKVPKPTQYWE